MQQENKNDSIQLSTRYQQYCFAKQHLRGTSRPEVFPIGEDTGEIVESVKRNKRIKSSARGFGASGSLVDENDITPTLTQSMGTGGNNVPMVRPVITPDRLNKRQNGRRFKEDGEPSFTLTGQDKHGVAIIDKKGKPKNKDYASTLTGGGHSGGNHSDMDLLVEDMKIRRLTPIECERLQGFPDNFSKCGINEKGEKVEISDSQRYKMMGNAVTTNVVKEIMLKLIK